MRVLALVAAVGCGHPPEKNHETTGSSPTSSPTTTIPGATTPSEGTSLGSGRAFPDTSASIAILADQLPGGLSPEQQQFAVTHYVGTQKLTLDLSEPLRALNPDFLVLHYHLAIWQSAPDVSFIVDGQTWGNDYDTVTANESWFWHNEAGSRVASVVDGKLLMNVGDDGMAAWWASSFADQVRAGDYDAVFADSASPALLQWEAQDPPEPRLQGTGAADTPIDELGGRTYVDAWEAFMSGLDASLADQGIPLIPNTSAFVTTWDPTDYTLTAGAFVEGYADRAWSEGDWEASTDELLQLAALGKITILQNYLGSPDDVDTRTWYLANYLLVRGGRTYLDYFASGPFEWYPEWTLDLGAATSTGAAAADLLDASGVYRRDFERGIVLVNPSGVMVPVDLPSDYQLVIPVGGGGVPADGTEPGSLRTTPTSHVEVGPVGAAILLSP